MADMSAKQKLELTKKINKARALFKEDNDRDPDVSVAEILDFIKDAPDAFDEVEIANSVIPDLEAAKEGKSPEDDEEQAGEGSEEATETKKVHIISATVANLAAKLSKDSEAMGYILNQADNDEEAKVRPVRLAMRMEADYTKEELLEFAVPGLRKKDQVKGDNRKPDITKAGVPAWWQDFTMSLDAPWIKEIAENLKKLEGKKGNAITDQRKLWQGRRTSAMKAVKTAYKIIMAKHQFHNHAWGEGLELVVKYRTKSPKSQELVRTNMPIAIKYKDSTDEAWFSYGSFLLMMEPENWKRIIEADDPYDALTPEREPNNEEVVDVPVDTADQAVSAISEVSYHINDEATFWTSMRKLWDAKDELGDARFLDGYRLMAKMESYFYKPENKLRASLLLEAADKEAKAKAKDAA